MARLQLTSPAFSDGGEIPHHHGYYHGNNSPPLTISGIPMEAKSLALIMDDPDAAKVPKEQGGQGKVWVHWVVWNIGTHTHEHEITQLEIKHPKQLPDLAKYFPDPTTINIPESVGNMKNPSTDAFQFIGMSGCSQGTTDFGEVGYGGPAPPDKRHTYVFKLYALDIFTDSAGNSLLDVEHGASKADVEKAMEGHIIEQTQLTGTYAP